MFFLINAIILCLLAIKNPIEAAEASKFSIGILLESKSDLIETAFRVAIHDVNVQEHSIELVPIMEYIDVDDSFLVDRTVCNLISQNVIAIFGPRTSDGSDIVASICNTLGIPHIVYDWSPSDVIIGDNEHNEMTLNLYPDTFLLARGYAELVNTFGWRSYTVVYESEKELQQLQDILQLGDPDSSPTTLLQLGDDDDYRPLLKGIKLSSDNCMILHCSLDKVMSVLQQADELKMLGEYQSVFLPILDTHTLDLTPLKSVGANITTVRLMDPTEFLVQTLVYHWEEYERKEEKPYYKVQDKIKTNMILINDAIWLFAKGLVELNKEDEINPPKVECGRKKAWAPGRRIVKHIRTNPATVSTGRVDFNEYGERNFFTLRFMEYDPAGFVDLAVWDPVNGLDRLDDEETSNKRVGEKLSNKTFIITSRIGAPFLSYKEPEEGEVLEGNARYEGYSMDLIDAIAKHLNFKYEFVLTPDGAYGGYNKETKQWNGLVGQLLAGNADLGICDLTMTSSRRQAVDFTPPFMTLGISILYSKPEVPPPNLFSFLSPFSFEVWVYMATAYLSVSFLIYGVSRMAPDDWENPHPCKEAEEVENIWCLMNITWLTMGSLMGQGCDLLPKAASTRLVTSLWWFFALMMLNSYTANLAAFLTMSRMGDSIESAEDLASQSKIKYGAVIGGSTLGFFKHSNFSTYQRMWAAMESARPSVFTKTNDEGVERVQKGKGLFAFLMESTTLEYIIERKCDLMQVGGWLDYKTYGIAMPFNSPYRKQISGAVLKLGEMGTLAELKRKWWKEMHGGGRCSQADVGGGDTPELDLTNVGGVFLVLFIGLFSALLIGLLEFLWNVKCVAIDEKISLLEALKLETKFALQVWITTKPVRTSASRSSGSSHSGSSSSSSSSSSKHSSKSLGVSGSRSTKSKKESTTPERNHLLTVHEKLRKISSLLSIKSATSEQQPDKEEKATPDKLEVKVQTADKATQVDKFNKHQSIEIVEEQPEPEHEHHHHHHHHRHLHRRKDENRRLSKSNKLSAKYDKDPSAFD